MLNRFQSLNLYVFDCMRTPCCLFQDCLRALHCCCFLACSHASDPLYPLCVPPSHTHINKESTVRVCTQCSRLSPPPGQALGRITKPPHDWSHRCHCRLSLWQRKSLEIRGGHWWLNPPDSHLFEAKGIFKPS